jgi:aminoglycoside phosphotransferase (APT) family kinase protein
MMDNTRLLAALGEIEGFEDLLDVERLSAGASRETYKLTVRMNGAETLLALRRSETDASALGEGPGLRGEAKLFQAARRGGVPGPDVLLLLRPEHGLGEGLVMTWIVGETLGARIARHETFAVIRPKLARQCGEVLAKLHAIDVETEDLRNTLQRRTPEDLVRETLAAYVAMDEAEPMIDYTAQWLLEHLPNPKPDALVHADFRNGNLMVDPETGIVAVLDWELAHIGDPMRDLGWLCTRSWLFGGGKPVGGFGEIEDLIAGYEAGTGARVDREEVSFWQVFGSFWWSVGTLSMAHADRTGDAGSAMERVMIGRRTSECQIDCVNLILPGKAHLPEGMEMLAQDETEGDRDDVLASVSDFLRGLKGTTERERFLTRVGANAVELARRERDFGGAAKAAEDASLAELIGQGDEERSRLCRRIRAGDWPLSDPKLQHHLRNSVLAQALIDQPGYPGVIEALTRV